MAETFSILTGEFRFQNSQSNLEVLITKETAHNVKLLDSIATSPSRNYSLVQLYTMWSGGNILQPLPAKTESTICIHFGDSDWPYLRHFIISLRK